MQSEITTRPYSCDVPEVYNRVPDCKKRSTDQRLPEFNAVVLVADLPRKRLNTSTVVALNVEGEEPSSDEDVAQEISKKREREEEKADPDLIAVAQKMERLSVDVYKVQNQDGNTTLAIELDPSLSLDMTDEEFIRVIRGYPHFTSLTVLQARHISDVGLILSIKERTQLQAINISACPKVTDWALCALARHCPNLTSFSIVIGSITDKGVEALANGCRSLQVVNLDWCCDLTDKSLEALGRYCPNLREFSCIEANNFTLGGFKALYAGCRNLPKEN